MPNKPLISAVINVHNEAESLSVCLKSLQGFADELIVVDMQSTDASAKVADSFNAKVYPHRFLPYVEPARNFGISKATGKWIMILDPDEYLNKSLKAELRRLTSREDVDFVKIPRKNIIFGKWLRHSNSWPDYLIRFFRQGTLSWNKEIHSQPQTKGNSLTLLDSEKLAIRHHNYQSIFDFVQRALRYSRVQADELGAAKYVLKTSDFILKPVQEFNSRFFAAQGYKDGLHGLVFCLLQTFAILLVYLSLWEKQGFTDKVLSKDSFVSASLETNYEYAYWFSKYFKEEYTKNIFKRLLIRFSLLFNRLTKNF